MLNTLSHKGNANQNYTKISLHTSKIGNHQENKQQMLVKKHGKRHPHTLLVEM
jgi:hypothetical protein